MVRSTSLRDKIEKLPKGDVHNHLHLGGSSHLLKKKYSNTSFVIPQHYAGFDGMMDYIINHVNTIMLTSDDVIYFMEMALSKGIDDNVEYLEASVDIGLVRYFDNSINKLIDVVEDLKIKYKSQINFQPDIGINKDYQLDKVYSDGLECINSGVFNGIDLYGKESERTLNDFKEIFDHARLRNIKPKVHIGEFSNCQTIEDAITILKPVEIQHGIKAADSEITMNMILDNNIQLNICPQSNIALGTVKNILEHPIRKLYDHGIKITINTDDHLLFNATITDQYLDLLEHQIFSFEEIESIRKNALD